jgi:hypothetical protein
MTTNGNTDTDLLAASQPPDRTTWRNASIQERHKAFDALYIEHDDVLAVERIMANKLQEIDDADVDIDCERYYDTPDTLGSGLMVIGEPGTGKTTFAKRVMQRHPRVITANQTFVPAVYMRIPPTVTPKGMGEALLMALRDPNPKGKAKDLLHRCILLMRKCQVRILMIDDFQDIPARRSKGIAEIGDWLRTLIDATPTLIIAMGTPSASIVRDSSDQVRKRIQATAHFLPFLVSLNDPGKWEEQKENLQKWFSLLGSLDNGLPLAESSNLKSPETALLLLHASNGGFSHLKVILRHAIACAVERSCESISREHLKVAFERTFGSAAVKGNPFENNYDGEPLIRPGQAFFKYASGVK